MYVVLGQLWHKVDPADGGIRLVCGALTPKESESTAGKHRPLLCEGCAHAFPTGSVVSTHETNIGIYRSAIAASVTEEKREDVMRFFKLALAASRAAGAAEERIKNGS